MPLIRQGQVTEDLWTPVDPEVGVGDGVTHALVPLAYWKENKGDLKASNRKLGVLLSTADDIAEIIGDLDALAVIAIEMPMFKDGRIFSSARLLRERHGYDGEIRAQGDVLPDQALYLARCGVNEIQIADESRLGAFQNGLKEMTIAMQPTRALGAPTLAQRPIGADAKAAAE